MLILRCEAVTGRRYELNAGDSEDEVSARALAARAASLLARIGNPGQWAGGRVTITDRNADRLVAVFRIVARKMERS